MAQIYPPKHHGHQPQKYTRPLPPKLQKQHVVGRVLTERIAFHKRNMKERAYTSVKDHMPSAHRFVSDWNPGYFLDWAKGIHPEVRHYLQVILDSYPYPEQAYKSCLGILGYDK